MTKDDYFVIAYRILAYLYMCVKTGEKPDINEISYNNPKIDIHESYWEYVMTNLYREGYIEGVELVQIIGEEDFKIKIRRPRITPKGIAYLQDNSSMKKALAFIKSLKEIIPGI